MGNNSDFVSNRFCCFEIFSRVRICGGCSRLWAQGKVWMMSNWSSLIRKVHHLECSGYSGGAIKFIYTLLWAWKTILSMSFTCPNHSICILNLNIPYFECFVLQFTKPQLLLGYASAQHPVVF